jgi:hypothetical protein
MAATPVLRPGDWVHFDGGEHQVVGLAGTTVRLRAHTGDEQVLLAAHLMGTEPRQARGGRPQFDNERRLTGSKRIAAETRLASRPI